MDLMELVGVRVRERRVHKGWSPYDLARESRVSQATIWRLENGAKRRVDIGVVRRLALALGTSVDYLIGLYDLERSRQL